MSVKVTKKDIIWSYCGKVFQISAGVLVLPYILRILSVEEIAIWYVFQAIITLVNLLDFGLLPNVMRHCSYIFSGASELVKEGVDVPINEHINYELLGIFIGSVKRVYQIIAIFVFIILTTIGTFYIYNVIKSLPIKPVMIAWFIFSVSASLNLYYLYFTPLLNGQGKLMQSNKAIVYSKVVYILLSYILLAIGMGLIGIAIANMVGAIVNRFFSRIYFFSTELKEKILKKNMKFDKKIVNILWHNSSKMGMISISYFMMTKASILLIANYLSAEDVAAYGLTMQLVTILITISYTTFVVVSPKLNMLAVKQQTREFLSYSGLVLISSLSAFIVGAICIIIFGDHILNLIDGNVSLLNKVLLVIISIDSLLSINYSIINQLISTKNIVPYTKASIVTGFVIIITNFLILQFTKMGLFGIVISSLMIQSFYNYWRWPKYFLNQYNTKLTYVLKEGFSLGKILLRYGLIKQTE